MPAHSPAPDGLPPQRPASGPEQQPERLDAFMARANAQYYATHPLLTDFITAPEISQVFGELLGAWAATVWLSMGQPERVVLAEAGPGRGTLMADMLRLITSRVPTFAQALEVHLVETSPLMQQAQAKALTPFVARFPGIAPVWHTTLESLPDGPLILVANEFLDALPIRQFLHTAEGWQEHYVQNGAFCCVPCPAPSLPDGRTLDPDYVVEVCEPALEVARLLGNRFAHSPGAALFLDYGHTSSQDRRLPPSPAPCPPRQTAGSRRRGRPDSPCGLYRFCRCGAASRSNGPGGCHTRDVFTCFRADGTHRTARRPRQPAGCG
ncbi:ATP synthase subunit beta [Acetobacter malorum]|uniref:ATP synthase subunit beta n=1 Tax=Acetobacter malorum TaxID=178901 RepID=A0A177GDN8_9PROT|nr:ATP synthase subunit beta [Acetobacter malorum]